MNTATSRSHPEGERTVQEPTDVSRNPLWRSASLVRILRAVPELAALIVILAVLCVVFSLQSPYFFAVDNWINILEAAAVTGIIALPGTMLLIAGQFDLSVGSAAALCGVTMALVAPGHGVFIGIVSAMLVGVLVGVVNGTFVTIFNVNALITTLGMLAVLRGIAQVKSNGQTISVNGIGYLGAGRPFLDLPLPVIILAVLAVLSVLVMRYTVFGRSLYAIGANPVAAHLVGIKGKRLLMFAFIASGITAALSGLIINSQLGAASPNAANGLELSVVTVIVLGGASLHGGRGTIAGTLVGLLIISVVNNGLVLVGVSSFYQDVARGALLILAVTLDQLRQRFLPTS